MYAWTFGLGSFHDTVKAQDDEDGDYDDEEFGELEEIPTPQESDVAPAEAAAGGLAPTPPTASPLPLPPATTSESVSCASALFVASAGAVAQGFAPPPRTAWEPPPLPRMYRLPPAKPAAPVADDEETDDEQTEDEGVPTTTVAPAALEAEEGEAKEAPTTTVAPAAPEAEEEAKEVPTMVGLPPSPTTQADQLRECGALLDQLRGLPFAEDFNQPVDWRLLNVPTYPDVIKRPMDLGKQKKRGGGLG